MKNSFLKARPIPSIVTHIRSNGTTDDYNFYSNSSCFPNTVRLSSCTIG